MAQNASAVRTTSGAPPDSGTQVTQRTADVQRGLSGGCWGSIPRRPHAAHTEAANESDPFQH